MGTLICQVCGNILRHGDTLCTNCGSHVTSFSTVPLPVLTPEAAPLGLIPCPDAMSVERVVTQANVRQNAGTIAKNSEGPPQISQGSGPAPALRHGDSPAEPAEPMVKTATHTNSRLGALRRGPTVSNSSLPPRQEEEQPSGWRLGRTHAAAAAVIVIVLGLVIAVTLKERLAPMQSVSVPSLSGRWTLTFRVDKQDHPGQMVLEQEGTQLHGQGADDDSFVVNGSIDTTEKPAVVQLHKQYMIDGRRAKNPVFHTGRVATTKDGLSLSGEYVTRVPKSKIATVWVNQRGTWHAELIPETLPGSGGVSSGAVGSGGVGSGAVGSGAFTIAAWVLLFVSCGLMFASFKLFGHNGLVNIWSKNKYIPTQFEAQHAKGLKELGKPVRAGGVPLGTREDWNVMEFYKPKKLALTPEMRSTNPHMLLLGGGAKGKTRLMAGMIAHDIESNDRAVVILDSGGGLVDLITKWIAAHPRGNELSQRVTIIDPTSSVSCPAYNPLEMPDDGDLQASASAVVFGFKAIYTEPPGAQIQWNQQTANILRSAAMLLMVNGKTLTDLPRLLSDNDFRDVLLESVEKRKDEKVEYITLLDTWTQYRRLARTDQWISWVEPILNHVTPMLSDPRIRPILTKPHGDLNFKSLITERKILLVKIPQGQLDQNANLLGSLIVTGLKRAALSLASGSAGGPCSLYLDELNSFIDKETLHSLTYETRMFQIGLVGALRTLQHLPEDFRNVLTVNVGTMCVFALAKKDGELLGPQMFRVDGRKVKQFTLNNLVNRVNTSPQYELISDEEKLNIDRVVGQEERTFFCYRVGTVAGVFRMKAPDFNDIPDKDINLALMQELRGKPRDPGSKAGIGR